MASQSRVDATSDDQVCSLRLIDPKFADHRGAYARQCCAAAVTIFLVLCLLDTLTQTVLIAALGASSFIAFTMPHANSAKPRYLLGGYLVGTIAGCGTSLVGAEVIGLAAPAFQQLALIAFAATATGCAIFVMTVTNTEHPPAAGLALGFVLNEWTLLTVAVVLIGIACISLLKEVFKARLQNLL